MRSVSDDPLVREEERVSGTELLFEIAALTVPRLVELPIVVDVASPDAVMVTGAVDPREEKLRKSKVKAPLVLSKVRVEPAAPEVVVVPELNPSPPPLMVLVKVRFTPAARVIGP